MGRRDKAEEQLIGDEQVRQAWSAAVSATDPSLNITASTESLSHNLLGQKLGRKGRETRERILAVASEQIELEGDTPFSLSSVARGASLGMTSLYNYFSDITELLLAVLEPVMATADDVYVHKLREYWADEELADRCYEFVCAYHGFWAEHARLLHMRNNMADGHDQRMMIHRVRSTQPVIRLLTRQMHGDPVATGSPAAAMATVLMIGVERSVTVTTDTHVRSIFGAGPQHAIERYLRPAARLMELAIRDTRNTMGPSAA